MTFWVAGAVVVAGTIGAVASSSAANKQVSAENNATSLQANEFNTITGQEQPFMTSGVNAENTLNADLPTLNKPFTAADYLANQDPGYQFQLQTGAQALRNEDTPGVGSLSGPALKDLMSFNQNMAATGYQNAFNRYQTTNTNTYNRLLGIAELGQNAASDTGRAGTSIAQSEAATTVGAGNAAASGTLGVGNSLAGGANTIAGLMYLNSGNSNSGIVNPDGLPVNTGAQTIDPGGGYSPVTVGGD